jgi:hypothetical protein
LSLKQYLHNIGWSQCQVMDPNVDVCQVEVRLAWGDDPTIPQAIGFDKIAVGVKVVEEKIDQRRHLEAAKMAKRPRLDPAPRSAPEMGSNQRMEAPEADIRYLPRQEDAVPGRNSRGFAVSVREGGGGGFGRGRRF